MDEFTTVELAMMFSALDYLLIEGIGRQTSGVSVDTLIRIQEYLCENIGYDENMAATEELALKLASVLKGRLTD